MHPVVKMMKRQDTLIGYRILEYCPIDVLKANIGIGDAVLGYLYLVHTI